MKLVAAAVVLLAGIGSTSAAIKLIHMHNGRTLKAESVERDGDWMMAILADGNTIGFPASRVDFVEDDPLGREDTDHVANVVTSGREVVRRGAFRGRNPNLGRDAANPLAAPDDGDEEDDGASAGVVGTPASRAVGANRAVQPGQARPGQPVPGSAVTQQDPNSQLNLGAQKTQNPRSGRFNRLNARERRGGDN